MTRLLALEYETLRHRLTYRTDVQKALDGTELRSAASGRPREFLEVSYLLDEDDFRAERWNLFSDLGEAVEVPLRHERLRATANVTGTGVVVASASLSDWLVAGQRVLVENHQGACYASTIDSVVGTAVTLDDSPSGGTYEANLSWIMPLATIYLEDGPSIGGHPSNAAEMRLAGRYAEVGANHGTGAAVTTFDGLTVLDRRPSIQKLAEETFTAAIAFADYGGALEQLPVLYVTADIVRAHAFSWATDADRQWWKLFLRTVRGQWKPFLLATWRPDLLYHSQPSGTTIKIYDPPDYAAEWFTDSDHRRIQFLFADGTVAYRIVSGAVDNGDGTQTLTLTASITFPAAVSMISFLELCRLDADQVSTEHRQTHALLNLVIRVVEQ